eukprot:jgi/Botrbrau1/470/Bobra.110_2s0108.2
MRLLEPLAGIGGLPWGGYSGAERARIVLGREEVVDALATNPGQAGGVACLFARGNFLFDTATHRDFLGACLGTGIDRGKVGDILLVGEEGAHILVAPDLVPHFELSLSQVRNTPVQTREVPLTVLQVPEVKVEAVRSVEASMRLDAVASAGFRMSRSKMLDLIKNGDVKVNWRQMKADCSVAPGDVISCRGKGRVEIISSSMTKKGRHAVEMVRYV